MRIILAKMQIFTMAAAETKSGHDGRTADLDQLEDDNSFPKCVEFLARSMFCAFKFSNVFFIFVTLFHLAWFLGRLESSSQTLKLQAFYHWIIHACQTKLHNPEAQNPTSHVDRSRRLRILCLSAVQSVSGRALVCSSNGKVRAESQCQGLGGGCRAVAAAKILLYPKPNIGRTLIQVSIFVWSSERSLGDFFA